MFRAGSGRATSCLRELNQFPQAQLVYESLVNNPATPNADSILAQLALAECHNAQSGTSPAHADSAKRIFEDLVGTMRSDQDVRVEAGYNLGVVVARTDKDEAHQRCGGTTWLTPFLVKPGRPKDLGPKGRWSRSPGRSST